MSPDRNPRHLIAAAIHFSLAVFFGFAFYDRFWRWRHEIAEVNTSYVTPDGSNVTSGGMGWMVPCLIFAGLCLLSIIRYVLTTRHPKSA